MKIYTFKVTIAWFDDDGNDLPEPIESGGFDYYCDFDAASAIYNAV